MPGGVAGLQAAPYNAAQAALHPAESDAASGPSVLDYIMGFYNNVSDRVSGAMHAISPSDIIPSLLGNKEAQQPGIAAQDYQNQAIGEKLAPLGKPLSFVERIPTAYGIVVNPSSKDSFAQDGWGSLHDAWNDSANVSLGQSFLSQPIEAHNPFATGNESYWNGVQTDAYGGIDPTDPEVRKRAFESGGAGQFASGATDAVASWFLDPLVIGGKIAKVSTAAVRGDKYLSDLERAQVHAEMDAQAAVKGTGAAPISSSHIGDGLRSLWENRNDQNFLRNHPLLRAGNDNAALASVLAGSKDFDEFATVYLAARRDPTAMIQLGLKAPAMADALDRARADLSNAVVSQYTIPKIGEDGAFTHDWELTQEQIAHHSAIVADLRDRDQWLQRALGSADGTSGVYGTMTNRTFSPIAQVEDWRNARAVQRAHATGGVDPSTLGYTVSTKYQPLGPGSASIRVFNWFGSDVPRGYVNVAGVGASDSLREVEATLREARADPVTMRSWLDKYSGAATADQRQQVLHEMDMKLGSDLITRYLVDKGGVLDADAFTRARRNAETWMRQYHVSRDKALTQYRNSDNYLYDDASHEFWKFQPLESYQAQLVPLTDFGELRNALEHMDDQTFRLMVHKTLAAGEAAASLFSYMWKAGVLLRVGAIPKNVLESQMASVVFLGKLAGNPVTGVGHFAANRWDGLKAKFWRPGITPPESLALNASLGKMSAQEAHEALVGKVTELEALRRQQVEILEQNIRDGRAVGGEAYYARAPEHGVQVEHADVQTGVMQPAAEGKRPYLWGQTRDEYAKLSAAWDAGKPMSKANVKRFRDLHARATRAYLREQAAAGSDIVARREGAYQPVAINDLTDLELLPNKVDPGRFSDNPDVYVTQKYKGVVSAAPTAKATVSAAVGRRGVFTGDETHLPDMSAIYDQERLDDLASGHETITALDEQIDQVNRDLATLAESKVRPKRRQAGEGPISVTGASGRTYSAAGSNEGTIADVMRGNVTSAHKNALTMTAYDTDRLQSGLFDRTMRQTGGRTEYYPPSDAARGSKQYWVAMADFINTKVRNSELAQRLLRGDNPADVSDWLQHSIQGNDALRSLNAAWRDPDKIDQFVLELNHNLRSMLPSDALQQHILGLRRDITAKEVQAHLEGRAAGELNPVVSEQWSIDPLADPTHWLNKMIDKAYDKLWTVPEDRLARWPLYNTIYRNSVNRDLKEWLPHLEQMSEEDANQIIKKVIEPAARREGMKTVKRVIYSADRRTNPAEALRFLAPFYQVTANRFAYYGSQLLENPQNMARLFLLWNAIPTVKDANGNDMVTMPEALAKVVGLGTISRDIRFQKSYLNLISSGDPWYSPGAGPLVTVPLSQILRDNPNPPKWLTSFVDKSGILPHNYYGENIASQVEPTWFRRIMSSRGDQWGSTYTMILAQQTALYKNGQRPDQPTNKEITDRTNQLWNFRIAAAFISPAQPDVSTDNLISPAIELHRQYVQKYGQQADAMFLQDHPELYDYIVSTSSNPTGIDPTSVAAEREDQNQELIASLHDKSMAGLITNLAGNNGDFNSQAYNWEYGRPVAPGSSTDIRGPRSSAEDAIDQRIVSRGWLEYTQLAKLRDTLLAANGFHSINQSGAEWIKGLFQYRLDQIYQDTSSVDMTNPNNPIPHNPWAEAFAQQDNLTYAKRANTLQQIVGNQTYYDANIKAQPWLAEAAQYLELRAKVVTILGAMKAAGGSDNLAAQSNAWLAQMWDSQTKALRDADPQWADIANRYFANDLAQVIPGG